MHERYYANGKLKIPVPEKHIKEVQGQLVVSEAYCPKGHNLMSTVQLDGQNGIRFIYTDEAESRDTEIVITPVVKRCEKTILKGEAFEDGEIVRILCPVCRTELPVLCNCECGAPIYLFYLDDNMSPLYAQSVCSRVGCVRASELRHVEAGIREQLSTSGF